MISSKVKWRLLMILTHIITQIPCYFCQDPQYETCRQPFQCGNMMSLSYPFWGGNRPIYCGYPGFDLNCQDNVPFLNISSILYRVLEIDDTTQTLRVAREDLLLNNLCPTFLYNTTLNFQLFDFSRTSNDQNISLYYGCTISQINSSNQFNCRVNETDSASFYITEETSRPIVGVGCSNNVFVPINRFSAQNLSTPLSHSMDILRDALVSGFSIQWSANNSHCENCVGSGGICGYDQDLGGFACYCADRPYALTCNITRNENGSRTGLSELQKYVTLVVILGFTCIIIPSIILVSHFLSKCISSDQDKENNQHMESFILNHGSLAPKRYSYNEIKKITKFFTEKLGQGGFGSVYKGILPDGRLVAVKVLNETNNTNGEEFINEVASISRTSHVNVVNLMGFCYAKNKRALVYEFMPKKSLDKFIHKDCDHLGWDKLYNIAVGVARGLEYLHKGCNERIVHFDIKPQNVLLDEDFCPKISDFGLAKLCKKKQSILSSVFGVRGTIGYIAPEVFCRNFGPVSHKSDVYSYGMMVLEMAGAREIDEAATTKASENYFPDKIYEQEILRKNKKLYENVSQAKEEISRKMFLIGFWCIQTIPSDRPSITKVVEMLEGSVETIQIPPKPFLSTPILSGQKFSSSFSVDSGIENLSEGF